MSDQETRDFVHELSRDLSPVQRIARLRVGLARVIGLWLAAVLLVVAVRGISGLMTQMDLLMGGFGAILLGLCLVGLGGVVAALASGVPGREVTARSGFVAIGIGSLIAVGLGFVLLQVSPAADPAEASLHADVACLGMACSVAVLPGIGAVLYLARAFPQRPVLSITCVGVGAMALGAVAAQMSCEHADLRHLMVAHALAPAIGTALLGFPLFAGFRRLQRS